MTGRITTCDHQVCDLPPLLEWRVTLTGSVPCDSYAVTCPCSAEMAGVLHRAAGFSAIGESVELRGTVDEYVLRQSTEGRTLTLLGRGFAARLLDNESRPVTYQAATLSDILKNHVTPYGISCAEAQPGLRAASVYTVAAGESQWRALEGFCRVYGGFSPRFDRYGRLLAAPERDSGRRIVLDGGTPLLSLSKRENHYGVLSEALVIDKTRGVGYTVKNADFQSRGGQCRRVIYTPGQSTWDAMRYTGEYQIARSREDEVSVTAALPGPPRAWPGDIVRLERGECGITGDYRVAEVEHTGGRSGEITTLTLKERD